MKILRWFGFGFALCLTTAGYSASAANSFLRYVYGADGIDPQTLCWPNDDVWMLRGAKNPEGLAQLEAEKIAHGSNEVLWENIQNALCMVEVRDGKVDPAYMLEQVYTLHRQLVLHFVYASLRQDQEMLARLTTNAKNVNFGRAKPAARSDMDVYEGIIALIPVLRASTPAADKLSKTVSYRVPLGKKGFTITLVKQGSTWRVQTDAKTTIPLEFFFQ